MPGIYWLAVVLISIVGTLITDNLTDNLGIPLMYTTIFFTISLSIVFAVWYKKEKTLSIHTIITSKREAFYWLAILFTFALGTAAGDLFTETINLGYLLSAIIFGGLIADCCDKSFRFQGKCYFGILDSIHSNSSSWGIDRRLSLTRFEQWWLGVGNCNYKCDFPCNYFHLQSSI